MPTLSNVNGIITSLQTAGGIDVLRAAPPALNTFGEWIRPASETVHIEPCVVHNLSGRDLNILPEANRNTETIEIYTYEKLYVSDDGKDFDVVVYRGRQWSVILTMDYDLQGACYISYAQLKGVQRNI